VGQHDLDKVVTLLESAAGGRRSGRNSPVAVCAVSGERRCPQSVDPKSPHVPSCW